MPTSYLLANFFSLGSQKQLFGDDSQTSLLNQAALFFMAGFHFITRLQLLLQSTKYVRYLVCWPPLVLGGRKIISWSNNEASGILPSLVLCYSSHSQAVPLLSVTVTIMNMERAWYLVSHERR